MEKVVIIGGGPSGLAAAIYTARAMLEPLVIAGSPPGGQLMLTSDVENYPGFTSIQGPELIHKIREHAAHFGTRFKDENVKSINVDDPNNLQVELNSGESISTESILVTTGADAMWLNLESETRLRGRGVSACATCDGFFFKDKPVAVVGGGDTAMEEALTLTNFASHVYVLHRREEFRASKIMQQRVLDHEKITVLWGTEVQEVLGEQSVSGLRLSFTSDTSKNSAALTGENHDTLSVNGLFVAIGHKPNSTFLRDSGVLIHTSGYIITASVYAWQKCAQPEHGHEGTFDFSFRHATNKAGVFAAGDVVDYLYRQAASSVGTGVEAALEIEQYLAEK